MEKQKELQDLQEIIDIMAAGIVSNVNKTGFNHADVFTIKCLIEDLNSLINVKKEMSDKLRSSTQDERWDDYMEGMKKLGYK